MACPIGTYSSSKAARNSTFCISCPIGFTTLLEGSSKVEDCQQLTFRCPPGFEPLTSSPSSDADCRARRCSGHLVSPAALAALPLQGNHSSWLLQDSCLSCRPGYLQAAHAVAASAGGSVAEACRPCSAVAQRVFALSLRLATLFNTSLRLEGGDGMGGRAAGWGPGSAAALFSPLLCLGLQLQPMLDFSAPSFPAVVGLPWLQLPFHGNGGGALPHSAFQVWLAAHPLNASSSWNSSSLPSSSLPSSADDPTILLAGMLLQQASSRAQALEPLLSADAWAFRSSSTGSLEGLGSAAAGVGSSGSGSGSSSSSLDVKSFFSASTIAILSFTSVGALVPALWLLSRAWADGPAGSKEAPVAEEKASEKKQERIKQLLSKGAVQKQPASGAEVKKDRKSVV